MSVALCKWIFMDIHEFIKLLLVETKHEWGSLNSDYSPPLTLADPLFTPVDARRGIWLVEMHWTTRTGFTLHKMKKNRHYIDVNAFIGIFPRKHAKHSFIHVAPTMSLCPRRRLAAGAIVFIDSVLEDGTKSRGMCSPSWIPFENWCMIFDLLSKTRQMWSYLSSAWVRDPA